MTSCNVCVFIDSNQCSIQLRSAQSSANYPRPEEVGNDFRRVLLHTLCNVCIIFADLADRYGLHGHTLLQ